MGRRRQLSAAAPEASPREVAAVQHYACPLCQAAAGRQCISQRKLYEMPGSNLPARIRHPHKERLARVK
jgi:hypothetical protein